MTELRLGLKERLFQRYLVHVSRPSVVRRAVRSLGLEPAPPRSPAPAAVPRAAAAATGTSPDAPAPTGRTVRVAALQIDSTPVKTVTEYVHKMGEPLRRAVAAGADIVAYPEYVTYPLGGLLPGFGPRSTSTYEPPAAGEPLLADVARFMEPLIRNVYFTLFSSLAAAARVHIMAGATPLPTPDGPARFQAALFGPDGGLIGTQHKLHLTPGEVTQGFQPGDSLEVFTAGPAQVALPVCMDATYFETYRLAALYGAEIVFNPSADNDEWSYWKKLRGGWPRAQESPVYVVQAVVVGDFLGEPLTGKAAVYAPLELTPAGDGILAEWPEYLGDGMVVADLDLDALVRFREEHPVFGRLNRDLIRNYIPQIYERYARDRKAKGRRA